ncbi:carboxylesterase [Coprinopsis sp. MPI-PUGE-AT-0042]|nr:carboxylesterase [Coprinopsis sp. MPI-PUGE-AT-0042]
MEARRLLAHLVLLLCVGVACGIESLSAVSGFLDTNTTSVPLKKWLGIPFAQTTDGKNRWKPPVRIVPEYSSVFNASAYGPACLQGRADGGNGTAIQSFDSGASSDPKIDGSYLAARGIIFASYNYRLLGQTQNFGLLDTRAAVEWLRDNVRRFGGDPSKITLGEMTNLYMSAYHRDPIIRAAIMQSGDTLQPMWPENQEIAKISTSMGCPTGKGQLDCLREKSGDDLRKILLETKAQFQPVTDNVTVWKDHVKQTKQGRTARIPLLVGTNKDEGTLIVEGEPTAYLSDITAYSKSNNLNFPFTDLAELQKLYPVPSPEYPSAYNASAGINLAKHRTEDLKLPVWRYRWDHVAPNLNSRGERIGAFHGGIIRFVMGQWRTIVLSPPFTGATPDQVKISDLMVTAWTNFIKDPHRGPQIPGWAKYSTRDPSTLAILGTSTTGAVQGDHQKADRVCSYWNTVLPQFPQILPTCGNWTC